MKSYKGLGFELGYKTELLEQIAGNVNIFYSPYVKKTLKRNGYIKERLIEPSNGILKSVQRSIKIKLLTPYLESNSLAKFLYGGMKGKCNIRNAKVHQGKKYHFCTDIKSFFPSISSKRVYGMFMDNGFSTKNANLLTKLTTIENHLPQGTPTSTHIANLVFFDIDSKLVEYCKENNIVYTRFVDDLTFSSISDFKDLTHAILNIIKEGYFLYSHRKTFYSDKPVEVTGIVVKQNMLDVTDSYKSRDVSKSSPKSRQAYLNYMNRVQE